jgi:low temperature requirement protein LtrA
MTDMAPDITDQDELSVSPFELFFDLVFVFAVTEVAVLLHSDPTWAGGARALLILAMLWWVWGQYTWSLNAVGTESRLVRLALLAAMGGSLFAGISVSGAFGDDGAAFAIAYVIVLVLALLVYWVGVRSDPAWRRSLMTYLPLAVLGAVVLLIGGFVDPPFRTWLWLGGMAIELAAALSAGRGDFHLRAGHFAERYGLFVIIALGESIVAVGLTAADQERTAALAVALIAAFIGSAVLAWIYFDRIVEASEHRLRVTPEPARSSLARDAYTFLHFPLVAGIVLTAVAADEMVAHPGDPFETFGRTVLAGGLLLFAGAVTAIARMITGDWPLRFMVAGVIAAAAALALGGALAGAATAVIASGVLLLGYAAELRRDPLLRS